jgi:ABC-type sugar transport system ATPase subunit
MDVGTAHGTMPAHRMTQPAIRAAAIRKVYGRTVAVDDVSFEVERGEILPRF